MTTTPHSGGTPLLHGRHSTYTHHKCRCIPCTVAMNAWEAHRRRQTAYGRWQPYVSAIPIRTHVRTLIAAGMTWNQIATAASVNRRVITHLMLGAGPGRPPARRMRPGNAHAILAVPIPAQPPADGHAITDPTGPRRKLQALVSGGWPLRHLARQAHLDLHTVSDCIHGRGQVRAGTAYAIHVLYGQLWNADPATAGVRAQDVRNAHRLAASRRWAPPLAWDDDSINDPAAQPDWTGRCGSTGGYYDHSQLGTPTCQPCRDAVNAAASQRKFKRRARQAA